VILHSCMIQLGRDCIDDFMAAFIKTKLKAARDLIGKKDFQGAYDAASQVLSYDARNYNA